MTSSQGGEALGKPSQAANAERLNRSHLWHSWFHLKVNALKYNFPGLYFSNKNVCRAPHSSEKNRSFYSWHVLKSTGFRRPRHMGPNLASSPKKLDDCGQVKSLHGA